MYDIFLSQLVAVLTPARFSQLPIRISAALDLDAEANRGLTAAQKAEELAASEAKR